jgi:hypothetical protein
MKYFYMRVSWEVEGNSWLLRIYKSHKIVQKLSSEIEGWLGAEKLFAG